MVEASLDLRISNAYCPSWSDLWLASQPRHDRFLHRARPSGRRAVGWTIRNQMETERRDHPRAHGPWWVSRTAKIQLHEAIPDVPHQGEGFIPSDAAEVGRIESKNQIADLVTRQNRC
jgi:hypothetical protein